MNQVSRSHLIKKHQHAQRLLKPLRVVNPYADKLSFTYGQTRNRRDHEKYLTLIDAIALLHQHQREIKRLERNDEVIEYIEVVPDDIELANKLTQHVLIRSMDELPPQTRQLLNDITKQLEKQSTDDGVDVLDCQFTQKQVRQWVSLGNTQLREHLKRLVNYEYITCKQVSRYGCLEYQLLDYGETLPVSILSSVPPENVSL